MSQASDHVSLCLDKAKKQIKACEKEGKSPKHRGLIQIEPDIELAKKHIAKAEHNLKAVSFFANNGFSDWSITAGFYCYYQCFLAIIAKFGYESRNQTCTIALIESLKENGDIDLDTEYIDALKYAETEEKHESSVIESREEFSYGVEINAGKPQVDKLTKQCKQLIESTKEIVFAKPKTK